MTNIVQTAGAVAVGSSAVLGHIVELELCVKWLIWLFVAQNLSAAILLAWNLIGSRRDARRANQQPSNLKLQE